MRPVLLVLALGFAAPAHAGAAWVATIDGNTVSPPVSTTCVGTGAFALSPEETQPSYEIQFQNWVTDEFAAHVHEQDAPAGTDNHIVDDIASGPDKIGFIKLGPADVQALYEDRLFVLVHTTRYPQGVVKGWIVPSMGAISTTWGTIRSLYR